MLARPALPYNRRACQSRRTALTRRALLLGASAGVGAVVGPPVLRPTNHPGPAFPAATPPRRRNVLNDASQLSPTPVASHVTIRETPRRAVEQHSRSAGRGPRGGPAVHRQRGASLDGRPEPGEERHGRDARPGWLEADTAGKTYRVGAGARWSTVIAQARRDWFFAGRHAVEQRLRRGEHVLGQRARLAGAVQRRRQHRARDDDAPGGRTPVTVLAHRERGSLPPRHGRLRPVRRHHRARARHGAERAAGTDLRRGERHAISARCSRSSSRPIATIQMAYGRMDVALDRFFERALLITYRPARDQARFPPRPDPASSAARRATCSERRSSPTGPSVSAGGPRADVGPRLAGNATRNSLMNEPVITLDDRDPVRTDILHEYFVAPERFADFVAACQDGHPGVVSAAAEHHAALRRHRSRQHPGLRARSRGLPRCCCSRRRRPFAAKPTWRA